MNTYHMHEGTLQIPSDWEDSSMHLFSWQKGPSGLSLIIRRDEIEDDEFDLEAYAQTQERNLETELAQFSVKEQRFGEIGGAPAFFLEFTWESDDGLLHQLLTAFRSENRLLSMTGTVVGKMSDEQKEKFLEIFNSFTARLPEPEPEPA